MDGYSSYPVLMGLLGLLAFGRVSGRARREQRNPSLGCEDGSGVGWGGEVPVTWRKTKSLQVIFHRRWKLGYLQGQTDKKDVKTSLCKITGRVRGTGEMLSTHPLPMSIHSTWKRTAILKNPFLDHCLEATGLLVRKVASVSLQ